MTSQKRYYELKDAGICTKCGKNKTDDSISAVRCKDCHEKYMTATNARKQERKQNNICIQCGEEEPTGNSNLCISCRQHNADLKRSLDKEKQIVTYKENNQNCRICNNKIDTLGVVCQQCLSNATFSQTDAIKRYNSKCMQCLEGDLTKLKLVSSDISQPMKSYGTDLYKSICYSTNPPKEYRVLCHDCYWKEDIEYIKEMRDFFSLGLNTVTLDPDIIDVDYEQEP